MLNYVWEFEGNINPKTVWLCLEKVPSCTSNLGFAMTNSRQQLSDVSRDQRALPLPSGHRSKLVHEVLLTLPAVLLLGGVGCFYLGFAGGKAKSSQLEFFSQMGLCGSLLVRTICRTRA